MSGTDSPVAGSGADTALSFDDGVAAIEGFLSSVPDGLEEDDQDSAQNEESQNTEGQEAEASEKPEGESPEEEDLELDLDASEEEKPAPDEPAFKAGQFASKDAKVKLDDGSTISVADLIAGNMFQATFTKKTTELSAEKKAFEQERGEFADAIKQVEHQRNVILTLAQKLLPKEPTPVDPNEDPAGYLSYLAEREAYQNTMGELQGLWQAQQAEHSKLTEKQKKEIEEENRKAIEATTEWAKAEESKFIEAVPRLKDAEKFKSWVTETEKLATDHYKLTREELSGFRDSRYLLMLHDATAFRKALAKQKTGTPSPPAQAQQPRIPQKQRMAPQATQNRDHASATDRLRKTGSIFDAAKALEKFV